MIGGDCNADGSVNLTAGQNKVCTITNTKQPTLKVTKILNPTDDPGRFDLLIDSTVEATAAGHLTMAGPIIVSAGDNTVAEME